MSLNPPLNSYGDPLRVEGEFFVMKRKGMEFEFKVDGGGKYSGKGTVVLTTCRLICLNEKSKKFLGFELPISLIRNPDFKQPIFGANYICGDCDPLLNRLPGTTHFKIWFMEGGCGKFAPAYLKMCISMKKNRNQGVERSIEVAIQSGNYQAFADPNDPSVIYMEQPPATGGVNNYIPAPPQGFENNGYQVPQQRANNYPEISNYQQQQYQQQQYQPQQYQQQQYQQQQYQPQQYQQQQYQQQQYQPQQYQQQQYQQNQYPQQNNQYYPQQGLQGLNNVQIPDSNQNQDSQKYFGFFGPNIGKR